MPIKKRAIDCRLGKPQLGCVGWQCRGEPKRHISQFMYQHRCENLDQQMCRERCRAIILSDSTVYPERTIRARCSQMLFAGR